MRRWRTGVSASASSSEKWMASWNRTSPSAVSVKTPSRTTREEPKRWRKETAPTRSSPPARAGSAKGKGRVAAAEIMIFTPAIGAVIRDETIHQIYSLMQAGTKNGMQTMNDALQLLYMKGEVTLEEALKRSGDPAELLRAVGEPVPGK